MKINKSFLVFLLFASIYILFYSGRITSSMDVDVIKFANNFWETGSFGSEFKLSGGCVLSPKTGLFYALEGYGVVAIVAIFSFISTKILSLESTSFIFICGPIFMALTGMYVYKIFNLFLSNKKSLVFSSIFGLASPLFVLSKMLFPEPFVMFSFSAALYYYFGYRQKKDNKYLFWSGFFTSLSLLMRPDSPIFYLFISLLVFVKLYQAKELRKIAYYFTGLAIFSFIWIGINYSRYGSILETGYTINKKQTEEVISYLNKDLNELETKINTLIKNNQNIKEKSQAEQQKIATSYQALMRQNQERKEYLEKLTKNKDFKSNGILANKEKKGLIILAKDYLYGLVLILIYPNRSIFFLSPILLFLLLGISNFWKKFKLEAIFLGLIIFSYISLYALRAPYGYAGTAAWGIRYALPTYIFMIIFFLGLDLEKIKEKTVSKYLFISLFSLSVIFQIIGSSVNYQRIQMPLESIVSQKYGKENISKSRIALMTSPSATLLLNNLQVLTGNVPSALKSHLEKEELSGVEPYFKQNSGADDWFFYSNFKQKKNGNTTLVFLLLLGIFGSSLYLLLKKEEA